MYNQERFINRGNNRVTVIECKEALSKYIIDDKTMKISKHIPVGMYTVVVILNEGVTVKELVEFIYKKVVNNINLHEVYKLFKLVV